MANSPLNDLVKDLATPSSRDSVVLSTTAGMTKVAAEVHRAPFVYDCRAKLFSLPIQAEEYATSLCRETGLRFRDDRTFSEDEISLEDYSELCEPEEPAACLRFLPRWGRCNADTNLKYPWQICREPDLPEWACSEGEAWYYRAVA